MKREQRRWLIGIAVAAIATFDLLVVGLYLTRPKGPPSSPTSPTATRQQTSFPPIVPSTSAQTNDLEAQNNLQNALGAANKIFAQYGAYDRATPIGLVGYAKPGLTYEPADTPSKGPEDISLAVSSRTWAAAAMSKTGSCFWIKDVAASPVASYGTGEPCTGQSALGSRAHGWG